MDWVKIGTALFLVAMLIFLIPQAKRAAQHSRKGSMKDWMGYILPMGMVVLFIILLISLV